MTGTGFVHGPSWTLKVLTFYKPDQTKTASMCLVCLPYPAPKATPPSRRYEHRMDFGISWWTIALFAVIAVPAGIAKLVEYWLRKAESRTQSLITSLQQRSDELQ